MNDLKNTIESKEYLSRRVFKKQAIVSIPIVILGEELKGIIKNGILYFDYAINSYYYSVFKTDPNYYEIVQKLIQLKGKTFELESTIWLEIPIASRIYSKLGEMLPTKKLFEIEECVFYPSGIVKNGRIYHLIQYTEKAEKEFTELLIKYINAFNEILGPGAFVLEEISEATDFLEFLKKLDVNLNLTEVVFSASYPEDFIALGKNLSMDPENAELIIIENEKLTTFNVKSFLSSDNEIRNFLKGPVSEMLNRFNFPMYLEIECKNGKCILKFLYERERVNGLYKILYWLIDMGIDIILERVTQINLEGSSGGRNIENINPEKI